MNLNNFFNPKSIAIVGVSSLKSKVGYALMANLSGLISDNKEKGISSRKLFPISLDESEILGHKAYKSIKEIPEDVDLALIAVRADIVPQIMRDCAEKKIGNVIIIAAGFKEMNEEGAKLEEEVAKIAKENNIALLGPNCLGTIDTHANLNASFAPSTPPKGHTAFISQSGALGTAILDKAISANIGFSKFISLGNEASLSELEFLNYLKDDSETKAILMYVEKLNDGRKFMEIAREITPHKPIVLIKAGRGESGKKAVMSHTGSLAPDDVVFRSACKQAGIIVVDSIREFFHMACLFELGIYKPIQKLAILTNAGGPAVITSDLIDLSHSLSLVQLREETKDKLRKVLPGMAGVNNPIDIIGDALSTRYESALRILEEEKDIEAIITILTPQMMTEVEATAKLLVEHSKNKTIVPVFIGGPTIEKALPILSSGKLINFIFPKDIIESLDNLAMGAKKSTRKEEDGTEKDHTKGKTPFPIQSNSPTLKMLDYNTMVKYFDDHKISLQGILVKERDDLREALNKLGGDNFSMKVISPDVIHKTDMGAVKLNIKSLEEAENAWDDMLGSVSKIKSDAQIEGVVIQKMASGKEVIIGMKRDTTFGPSIIFGMGGIFTEALKDTSLRIAPVTKEIALQMMQEIRGANILNGLRGEEPVAFDKLAELIVSISDLAMSHPDIMEIDLNPVMVRSDGVDVVDARVMVSNL